MHQAAALLLEKKEALARLISQEVGKVIQESRAEIEKCAWVCNFYADKAASFLAAEEILLPDSKRAAVIFQPLGIILGVMPWNFPFWQVIRCAVPVLMAGNGFLLKHASNVPQCALAIQDLFAAAGFIPNLFQTVLVDKEAVAAIMAAGVTPAGLEMMDGPALRAAEDFARAGYPKDAAAILAGKDDRLLVVVGPCSVHDPKAAMEYAHLLLKEARKHTEDLLVVMRVYFEKPRTTVGWKGLINDPQIDGSFRINDGLRLGRRLLADIADLGLPSASEFLDPITP
jgi:hypothetical protein